MLVCEISVLYVGISIWKLYWKTYHFNFYAVNISLETCERWSKPSNKKTQTKCLSIYRKSSKYEPQHANFLPKKNEWIKTGENYSLIMLTWTSRYGRLKYETQEPIQPKYLLHSGILCLIRTSLAYVHFSNTKNQNANTCHYM